MKTNRTGFLFLAVALCAILLTACDTYSEQASSVELQPAGNSSLMIITSEEYYFSDKQAEVVEVLLDVVNSGDYNIAQITTHYSSGYLTAAEVLFSPETGEGNKLRIALLQSDELFDSDRNAEVKALLDEARQQYPNAVKTVTIFEDGYLLAAEVWYTEE